MTVYVPPASWAAVRVQVPVPPDSVIVQMVTAPLLAVMVTVPEAAAAPERVTVAVMVSVVSPP